MSAGPGGISLTTCAGESSPGDVSYSQGCGGSSVSFTPLTLYYMSPTGSDAADGLTPATAWATPNHAVHCGDVIIAATGTYSSGTPFILDWGAVTNCPSTTGGIDGTGGIYVATVLCAGALQSCVVTSLDGGGNAIKINASHWAIEGFYAAGSFGATCNPGFDCTTGTGRTTTGYIAFINDISNGSSQGFYGTDESNADAPAGKGVDELAVVGSIAYNASQASLPVSCIDSAGPANLDALAGTHIYFAGNFAWHCYAVSPLTSDEQGFIFDTFDIHNYSGQAVIQNNISFNDGGVCIHFFQQNLGGANPTSLEIAANNTCYGDVQQNLATFANPGGAGGVTIESSSLVTYQVYNNILSENLANAGNVAGNHTAYAAVGSGGAAYSGTFGGSGKNNVFHAISGNCAAQCDPGDNVVAFNTASYLNVFDANNTYEDPGFQNTTDLTNNWFNTAPSCAAYTSTVACMGWNGASVQSGSVIYDLTPTAAGTSGKGYQLPGPCAANALYPTWLKGIVHLQWNAGNRTISEMTGASGLITKPCGM